MMRIIPDLRLLSATSLLFIAMAPACGADREPGGQGSFQSFHISNKPCFKANSSVIDKVCADYKINWKLWTLVGEPVGDYKLSWKIDSISFKDQQKRGGQITFRPADLPPELKKAASAIELYIDGYASVDFVFYKTAPLLHRFNTGVAVRANRGSSYNVPGSPSWGTVFVHNSPCDPKASEKWPVDEKVAKEAFKNGISLHALEFCPESGISNLTDLESAIADLCAKPGADGKYHFCPIQKKQEKQEKTEATKSIDAAFEKLEKQADKKNGAAPRGVDDAFAKLEAYRAEENRKRLAAIERIAQNLRITSFRNGDRVNKRVVEIKGDTQGAGANVELAIHFNESIQPITTNANGEFSTKVVLKSGTNLVKACFKDKCKSLQLQADVETLALMATLTWEGRGDLDLHVEGPSGQICSYKNRQVSGVCMLDIDDRNGVNPENISIPLGAPKGIYRFSVVNYSGVQGVSGVLKIYEEERLVETESFYATGSKESTVIRVEKMNYR